MFLKDLSKINADMVDGKHASNTANNVPVLDSNAKLPIAQVPTGTTSSTVALGNHNHDSVYTKPTGTITANRVAVFNDTTGRVIKDSGYTIATSVPSGAKFTDTVYTHPNDANTRHVTDTEKSTWNAKETTSGAQAKADAALASAKSYTDSKVAELVDSSPEALDTLNELAAALGDDPNFATTVSTQIGNKADTTYVDAELAKKSDKTHTHNYAGSSSVGGSANSAVKLATARTISATGDATGSVSFDGSKDVSVGLTLANSGATAGSYGPSANATASFGGTISVPQVTVDAKGRVTAASTKTITMPANPNSDTKVTNTLNTKAKAYVTGTTSATTNTGTQVFDTGVYLDSTAGKLVATTFQGDLVGNASTATSATSATKATQDSAGQQINSTYIKNLSVNGKTITFTKGDGTTGTITTQDTDTNTWRGVQDNLTSTATDQSLSANQGKVLKGLVDGKADSSHTHNYAGSSSAGGAATSANKVNTNLVVKLNGGSTEGTNLFTFNGSAAKTVNITAASIGAAASSHTHSYLPLSGGTITSADFGPLEVKRDGSTNGASIKFTNSNGVLGYIGMNGAENGGLVRYSADTNTSYTVLDTGNYKSTVTPANIGAATSGHTHNYAGSSSAGGAANSAVKATQDSAGQQINSTYIKGLSVSGKTITYTKGDGTTGTITTQDTNTTYSTGTASALGLTKLYTGTGTATDGTMTQAALKTALDGKSGTGHTHNYAGSSSAGGAATTALACTGNAATATALQTGRTINGTSFNGSANITTANWGTARTLTVGNTGKSVNGSGNVSWSLNEIGAMQGSTASATTAATAGWYRIAQTTSTDQANVTGTFTITAACSGNHSSTILMSGISYGVNPTIQQLSHTQYSATGISQARIVYHTTYSGNRAYLEVYVPTAAARTITVQLSANSGWTLVAPSTAGSIPSGYTNKAITLASDRIVSNVTGALSGNASTATKATQDSAGQQINTTYIKGLSVSGRTITYTKGDGTTGTITTQDTDTNTTYSAGTGLSLSGTTFNHKNSVTAATAQGDASKTLSWGGTFTIPTITYDAQGHITGKGTTTMTMPANPNSDTKVTNTLNTTTKAYITGTTSASTNTGTQIFDTGVYLDTAAGTLTATTFKGSLSGNATSATSATKATQDSAGQQINTTYIKGLSVSGRTITYTKGDGTTGTITTQDTDTDTKVTNTLGTTTKAYVTGTTSASTSTGTQIFDTGVYLDTTAGMLTATTFKGALSGNATTATTLATARTINGTSFNGSANITTANWGTARNIKIGNTSKSVNGSAAVTWTLAEVGAIGAKTANGYEGMTTSGGSDSTWIRTTSAGIIPYQSGGASSLGTDSWPFSHIYTNGINVMPGQGYGTNCGVFQVDSASGVHACGATSVYNSLFVGDFVEPFSALFWTWGGFDAYTDTAMTLSASYIVSDCDLSPGSTGKYNLGTSSYRWKEVYCTRGAFNGSDIKLKEDIKPVAKNNKVKTDKNAAVTSEDLYNYVKGANTYSFKYRNTDNESYLGIIANEIPDNIFNLVGKISTEDEGYEKAVKEHEECVAAYKEALEQGIYDECNTCDIEGEGHSHGNPKLNQVHPKLKRTYYSIKKEAERELEAEPIKLINAPAQIAMLQEVLSMALNKIEELEAKVEELQA